MKRVINWIKANLNLVICGAISVAGIALLVMGLLNDSAKKELETDAGLTRSLQGIQPVNAQVIDEALQLQKSNQRELKRVLDQLNKPKDFKPLHDHVFPEIPADREISAPFEFRDNYIAKEKQLLREVLKARDKPSDIRRQSGANAPSPESDRTRGRADRRGPRAEPSAAAGAGQVDVHSQKLYLIQAQQTYCYASPGSLDDRPKITDSNQKPTMEEMWQAQVAMWIQEEVLGALARVNEQAAEELEEKDRWVAFLPVKHLLGLDITDDLVNAQAGMGGRGRSMSPGGPNDYFVTHSGPKVDVLRFSLELDLEADALLQVIEELSRSGFYTLLNIDEFQAIQPGEVQSGYIYGPRPAVHVEMTFEVCLLQNGPYLELMPNVIKKERNIAVPTQGQPGTGQPTGANPPGGFF